MRSLPYLLALVQVSFASLAQDINLKGKWKFHINDRAEWSSASFDDSTWKEIYVPSAWEDQGYNGYDGFAWYRKKFDGRKLDTNKSYYMDLGFIDDADEVYINGTLVGFTGSMPPQFKTAFTTGRKYPIPENVIDFKGTNLIAVRVFDVTHAGGILEGDIGIYRTEKDPILLIDLQGIWSFATGKQKPSAEEHDWKKIMVPDAWEHQGYRHYDGYAWYKRSFTIPEKYMNEDLVLMLGKIDDFDKVYVNGQMIGSTNDHRPFALSHSYTQSRAYKIPGGVLTQGTNTIEVFVEDMGNIGGIYEGTIGIATKSNYEKYFRD